MKYHYEFDRNYKDIDIWIQKECIWLHTSHQHTHRQTYTPCTYNQDEQLELKNLTSTWLTDTQTFLVLLRGICVLPMCSSCWAALSHKEALIGLYSSPRCRSNRQNQLEQSLPKSLPPCLLLLVWTGLLKPMRNLFLQTYFADVSVETLGVWSTALSFVSITSGILIVYSPWLPTPKPWF